MNSTDDSARSLQIDIFTNVNSMPGHTFFINLKTDIENDAHFFTDVNGMYLIERRLVIIYKFYLYFHFFNQLIILIYLPICSFS